MKISCVCVVALATLVVGACAGGQGGQSPTPGGLRGGVASQVPASMSLPPGLPDSTGFGTHVLALSRRPNGETWVGTYGRGIYVWRPRQRPPLSPAARDSMIRAASRRRDAQRAAQRAGTPDTTTPVRDTTRVPWE